MIRFVEPITKQCFLLFLLSVSICCTTKKTEVYESQQNKEFKNGQTIFVKRTDELTRSYGAVSGRLYGEEHKFRYQFTINPTEVVWNGLLGEVPKKILYCGNILYLKTSMEQVSTDSVTQTVSVNTSPGYYKNVDKRYFFKWFGEQYFVMIDSLEYQSKKISCQEEDVPNM
jgi:hypothetical protein